MKASRSIAGAIHFYVYPLPAIMTMSATNTPSLAC